MSVMDMNSRMAMAEKLSVQQLQQAIQSGSLPAYIGIPLIEQKTKEKAQMAAAQQGQQKPPSVAASILQQAEQQEQQEQGIDQLPSNLPMMDEGENGMAGGGIVAFNDRGQVRDPDRLFDEMSTIDRIREEDPELYRRMFPQEGPPLGVNADTRDYSGNAQEGSGIPQPRDYNQRQLMADLPGGRLNVPSINPSTPRERVDQGLRETIPNPPDAFKHDPGYNPVPNPPDAFKHDPGYDLVPVSEDASPGAQDPKFVGGTTGGGAYVGYRKQRTPGSGTPKAQLPALPKQDTSRLAFDYEEPTVLPTTVVRGDSTPKTANPNIDSQYIAQDMQEGNRGITAAPGARLAPSDTPGASSPAQRGAPPPSAASTGTAPSGAVSPATARQISATNPGAPASLDAAERQAANGSPQAAAAVSMLDKYVAMLEKNGDDVGRQKKEALYMALIQGGLATAGGTSPNAFANLAAGMVPAVQSYQQALAGIRKDDRARIEKLLSAGLKKEEFLLKAEEIGVKRENARLVYDAAMARTGAMAARGSSGGDKDSRQLRQLAFQANSKYLETQRDAPKLKNTQDYKDAAAVLAMPLPKNASPMMVERRKQAQQIVDDVNSQITGRINEARIARDFWSGEANFDPAKMYSGDASSGNVPTISSQADYAKLPKGAKYKDPNGVLRTKG